MGHSAYIGRIGALAFALGVGIGLGATPAVALADDSDTSVSPPAADTPASEPDTEDTDTEDEDAPDDEDEDVRDRPHRASDAGEESEPEPEAEVDADEPETVVEDTADVLTEAAPPEPEPEPEPGPAPEPAAPVAEPAEAPASTSVPVVASPPPVPDRAPEAPAESALWLTVAASAVRRESDTPTSPAAAGLYSTLLTPAEVIRRLAEILIPGAPTDLVATDTHAYVAHTGSRSVTIIDTVAGRVVQTVSLRSAPTALAIAPNGTRLYVSHAESGTVSVISTATNSVVRTIRVGAAPTGIAVSRSGSRLYVVNGDDGTVSKISTLTNRVVGTVYGVGKGVSTIAVSPDGATVYTLSSTTGEVSAFTSASLFAKKVTAVTPGSPGITFSADGSRVFVADVAGSVQVVDTATRQLVDSIAVATGAPFDLAVSPDGATLLVARAGDGKLSVFDIASGTELTSVIADPYQIAGPPTITVSPDGTQLYWTDSGSNRMQVIALVAANGNPTAQTPIVNSPNASGAVTGSVVVTDPEGAPLSSTVSGPGKGSVTVSRATDGTFVFTYTPTKAARHDAAKVTAGPAARVDTFTLTFSDGLRGTVAVPITVTIAPANAAPTATARSSVSWLSAKVHGTVTAKDADRDTLTFTASPTAKGGTVTIGADGKFTYTPTAAARHAAANAGATQADKQDTFTVLVNDGHGGVTSLTVTVKVKPGNAAPKATVRTNASWFSAKVFGTVTARDADRDALAYSASATAKNGVVTMDSRGRFTYTPTDAARHAAASATATDADRRDTFDVLVDDGHGGVTRLAVTVTIKPLNAAPTRAAVGGVFTNPNTGLTTGRITAVDPDGDTLSYRVATNTGKGVVTVGADGTFSYVPTDQARAAAAKRFAPSWDRTDRFRVTVDDGHGGTSTLTVRVAIAPAGYTNQAPTNGGYSLAHSDPVSGKVTGTVTATDPERDAVVFVGAGDAGKGSVVVDRSGGFVYTPRDDARRRAGAADATAADRQDTFTVLVLDAYGDGTTISVVVPVVGVPVV
ncbi:YVTN beta-propeller repeat-containing protein [Mycolicibacterium vaccae ATCC 25954]|uniref:YVTN beta-propeller repeat-containing protein n=2 Tax=Mycolicibacterium vaccae TaxID=1810 RepID=K0VBW7_MYCVA|nr:YVTN beta-propeller repeat-containing protein [Mycolicibacterium vaccae ATCC 25954]